MLFVAFGALVLVPLLTGLDPSIALFSAGAGTLIFQIVTKRMVPVFLASSFAFIAPPISFGVKEFGMGATLGGLACAGLAYIVFSAVVKVGGVEAIEKYLPAIVTGPVIMVIGLKLAPIAVNMAKSFDASGNYDGKATLIAFVSLLTAILTVTYGKKNIQSHPYINGYRRWLCSLYDTRCG